MVKTDEEVLILREGGKRLARVVAEVAKAVVPGVTTLELNDLAEKLIRENGDTPSFLGYTPSGAKRPFPAAICISINEEIVHGVANEDPRTVQNGDIVSLDCGVTHKGLITDHAISVIAGDTKDAETRALLQATKDAMMAGINAAKGGARVGDISAAIEKIGVEKGYGIVYELGGHGVGHRVHEEPYIPNVGDAGTGEELLPNMVLAIEPMFTEGTPRVKLMPDGYTFVTKDGSRAAHFEHTILITKGKPEILTLE
ncbi:type I methionyl aminopeptidase [Patescibacteria group bacterium]|nr:type I methionyl aminopeptidase [Patescibacteria group bacterium]